MVHGTFPLAKFGFILLKQIANPIHKGIVFQAKRSSALRKYVCIPIAECFHTYDVRIRYPHENWSKMRKATLTDEKNAIETGAHIIAEIIMGFALFLVVFMEYKKYSRDEMNSENTDHREKMEFIAKLNMLECSLNKQNKQLDELFQFFSKLQFCLTQRNE